MSFADKLYVVCRDKNLTFSTVFCATVVLIAGVFIPRISGSSAGFSCANFFMATSIFTTLIIAPMFLKNNSLSSKKIRKNEASHCSAWVVNWLIKPIKIFATFWFFFYVVFKNLMPADCSKDYLLCLILICSAPVSALAIVWSYLKNGGKCFTVSEVLCKDPIVFLLISATALFLIKNQNLIIPWETLFLSIVLFAVMSLLSAILIRNFSIKSEVFNSLECSLFPRFNKILISGFLLILLTVFVLQGYPTFGNNAYSGLCFIALILGTLLIFFTAYYGAKFFKLSRKVASNAGIIGATKFFELSIAVLIAISGMGSSIVFAALCCVLFELPIVLLLKRVAGSIRW